MRLLTHRNKEPGIFPAFSAFCPLVALQHHKGLSDEPETSRCPGIFSWCIVRLLDSVRAVDIAMNAYYEALDAAHRSIDDGSINEIHTRRDEYGYRSILAHCDQGWFTWYNEADEPEGKSE